MGCPARRDSTSIFACICWLRGGAKDAQKMREAARTTIARALLCERLLSLSACKTAQLRYRVGSPVSGECAKSCCLFVVGRRCGRPAPLVCLVWVDVRRAAGHRRQGLRFGGDDMARPSLRISSQRSPMTSTGRGRRPRASRSRHELSHANLHIATRQGPFARERTQTHSPRRGCALLWGGCPKPAPVCQVKSLDPVSKTAHSPRPP